MTNPNIKARVIELRDVNDVPFFSVELASGERLSCGYYDPETGRAQAGAYATGYLAGKDLTC